VPRSKRLRQDASGTVRMRRRPAVVVVVSVRLSVCLSAFQAEQISGQGTVDDHSTCRRRWPLDPSSLPGPSYRRGLCDVIHDLFGLDPDVRD